MMYIPLDIVEYRPDGRAPETIFDTQLVMFFIYGDNEKRVSIVLPVKPVETIPPKPEPGFFYTGSGMVSKALSYADALTARAKAVRYKYVPKMIPPLEYVPSTRYFEIDANAPMPVITDYLGAKVKRVSGKMGNQIAEYFEERYVEVAFTPAERIELLLSDDELEVVNLKLWSKRKKAVLARLMEKKFELTDIAAFFRVTPEEILKAAKKLNVR